MQKRAYLVVMRRCVGSHLVDVRIVLTSHLGQRRHDRYLARPGIFGHKLESVSVHRTDHKIDIGQIAGRYERIYFRTVVMRIVEIKVYGSPLPFYRIERNKHSLIELGELHLRVAVRGHRQHKGHIDGSVRRTETFERTFSLVCVIVSTYKTDRTPKHLAVIYQRHVDGYQQHGADLKTVYELVAILFAYHRHRYVVITAYTEKGLFRHHFMVHETCGIHLYGRDIVSALIIISDENLHLFALRLTAIFLR